MSKPKQIINDPKLSVDEFIAGLLLQYPNRLQKLRNHHVVLAAKPPSDKVQLLSGGGSGHEPSHAGWIGPGMLSGAICGGIFASPSVASILAGIRAAAATQTNKAGILLVVKNYTGDRLNFGMACEMANQEGIPCRLVVVADDCALERTKGITGARGVAGTVLVHKIAGAAAVAGKSLHEIVSIVDQVNGLMGTLGIALDAVTIVGAETVNDRLDDKTIEIGLGIHGEAGLKQSPLLTADEMAKEMITTIREFGRIVKEKDGKSKVVPLYERGNELCILVNNLGGTSNFEMSILANSCVKFLETEHGCKVTRVFVGAFMTSFDMHGASVTVLNLSEATPEMKSFLDAPCDAPAWSTCDAWQSGDIRTSSEERPEVVVEDNEKVKISLPPVKLTNFSDVARRMALKASASLGEHEALLTKYDLIVGDGDCGITMKRGATEVEKRINDGSIPTDHPVTMFASLADAVSDSMGGTSGVLIELMFRKMSSTLSGFESIGVGEMSQAFQAGVDAICLYGGASVGSRTMLDALVPAASTLVQTKNLVDASRKAKYGADGTAQMKSALAGRSNYLSEETLEGTPDPGAVAVSIVFEALHGSAS
ncbi:dihydroxyacetone kinase [Nitzschia inconspicua]|uniref:Dihydroxyacetone kinase n=1 Tax=Nitzschia inconspicua TaxID=303405 RepID=A0A9K3LKR3_9STRA|nr:dihydroxyacetone kinase [Nitzschia inconspicua]